MRGYYSFKKTRGHVAFQNEVLTFYGPVHCSDPKMFRDVFIYSRITYTKSPSVYIANLNESLTNLTALLAQSHDCGCYVSRRILTGASTTVIVETH